MNFRIFLLFFILGYSQIALAQKDKISLEKIEILSQKGAKYKIAYELRNQSTKVIRLGKDPVQFIESPTLNFEKTGLSRGQLNQVKGAILQNGGTLNPKQIWSYDLKLFMDETIEVAKTGESKKTESDPENKTSQTEEDWSKKEWEKKVADAKEKEQIAKEKEKKKEAAFQEKLEASRNLVDEETTLDNVEEKVEGENCPDVEIESVKIIKKKPKKWILVEYTIINNGDAKAPLLKEFEKHGYQRSLGLKIFFSGDTKLGRGDVTVGGAFIGHYGKSKKEFMEPGERITEQIKIKTKNQTSFTRVVIFNIDAMQFIEECNEKNNISHLINR